MNERCYRKPPWIARKVGNRMSVLFQPSLIVRLSVAGRRTGRTRTVPLVVLHHDDARYLVSVRGEADWVRNLRESGTGTLKGKNTTEAISVTEVPVQDRAALLAAYAATFGKMPTVTSTLRALPDPADHPIFRIATRPTARAETA